MKLLHTIYPSTTDLYLTYEKYFKIQIDIAEMFGFKDDLFFWGNTDWEYKGVKVTEPLKPEIQSLGHPWMHRYPMLQHLLQFDKVWLGCLDAIPIRKFEWPDLQGKDIGIQYVDCIEQPLIMTGGMFFNNDSQLLDEMIATLKYHHTTYKIIDDQLVLNNFFKDKKHLYFNLNYRWNLGITNHEYRKSKCDGDILVTHWHPEFPTATKVMQDSGIIPNEIWDIIKKHNLYKE